MRICFLRFRKWIKHDQGHPCFLCHSVCCQAYGLFIPLQSGPVARQAEAFQPSVPRCRYRPGPVPCVRAGSLSGPCSPVAELLPPAGHGAHESPRPLLHMAKRLWTHTQSLRPTDPPGHSMSAQHSSRHKQRRTSRAHDVPSRCLILLEYSYQKHFQHLELPATWLRRPGTIPRCLKSLPWRTDTFMDIVFQETLDKTRVPLVAHNLYVAWNTPFPKG